MPFQSPATSHIKSQNHPLQPQWVRDCSARYSKARGPRVFSGWMNKRMNQRSSYIDHTFPHSSCVCLLLVCSLGLALWLQHFAQFILCLEEYPFIVHPENSLCIPPSELSSNISCSGQPSLTSLNGVKNFMLPEFHLVFLCNNLLQNRVVKITVYYVPGFCGICTWHGRVSCPYLSWKSWQQDWDHLMTGSFTWLVVDGRDQSYGGWNSGGSLDISFCISVVSPYCSFKVTEVFPRWFRAQKVYRERERERENQEREREPGESCSLYMT